MSANVANQQTNDTTKKTPVKRVSLKQRKDNLEKAYKLLDTEFRNCSLRDKERRSELSARLKELEKEEKILANQEKKARESFQAAASLYEYNGIYENENYLVLGVLTFQDAKDTDFQFRSESEFKQFREWYYELYKDVLGLLHPKLLMKNFVDTQKELGREFNGDKWVEKEEDEEADKANKSFS